jgi:hypothetical protein
MAGLQKLAWQKNCAGFHHRRMAKKMATNCESNKWSIGSQKNGRKTNKWEDIWLTNFFGTVRLEHKPNRPYFLHKYIWKVKCQLMINIFLCSLYSGVFLKKRITLQSVTGT